VHAYVAALSAELGGVRIADESPALGGLRVLHVQHDVRSKTVLDMAQRVLEAKLGSVPVVITEHAVDGQAQAWERDADVLVAATQAGAERLRARWRDRRVEMIPYGCPPIVATPKRAPGRVLAVLGTLEEPGPWRALELVRELDDASVLVVAPRACDELELAWAESVGGLRVERVGERLDPLAAARRIASTADVAAFWDDEDAPLAASLDVRAVLATGVAVVTEPSERFADVREATAQAVDVGQEVAALLSDPRAAAAVGERARAFCRAHSWRTVAQRHLDLWKSFEAS
jgi:glycosyltransferase involved in cell wall biosynthesis